ncbi:MAG: DUF3108 domain-containing protein [Alphaproteobacteria bacterium]|nr:DUF3108 domain-containing protein [Alphaproteobacteria bacterium]
MTTETPMIAWRTARIQLSGAAIALFLLTEPAQGANDLRRFSLSYDVSLTGISVMSLEARASVTDERYSLRTYLFTFGVLDFLFRLRSESATDGAILGDRPRPNRHTAIGTWRGDARFADLQYHDDGVDADVRPDAATDDRDPVPPKLRRGTLDPLSAFLAINLGERADGPCPAIAPIFDGRRRYNAKLEPAGSDILEAKAGSIGAGLAIRCLFSVEPIVGYQKSRPLRPRPPSEVWFQRVFDESAWVPVRIRGESFFGSFTIDLRDYEPHPEL